MGRRGGPEKKEREKIHRNELMAKNGENPPTFFRGAR